MAGRVILLRRVSGRPGAEGAPFEGRATLCCWRVLVLEVEAAKPDGGAMRRDWLKGCCVSYLLCNGLCLGRIQMKQLEASCLNR